MTLLIVVGIALIVIAILTEGKRITNAVDNAAATLHVRINDSGKALRARIVAIEESLKEKL